MKSRSREIINWNHRIALKFETHIGRSAADVHVKYQSDRTIVIQLSLPNFARFTIRHLIGYWNGALDIIGSRCGFVIDGTQTLRELILTNHQWSHMAFTWGPVHYEFSRYELLEPVENLHSRTHLPRTIELTEMEIFHMREISAMPNMHVKCKTRHTTICSVEIIEIDQSIVKELLFESLITRKGPVTQRFTA